MTAATQQAGSPDNEPVRVNHTVRNIVIALIVVALVAIGGFFGYRAVTHGKDSAARGSESNPVRIGVVGDTDPRWPPIPRYCWPTRRPARSTRNHRRGAFAAGAGEQGVRRDHRARHPSDERGAAGGEPGRCDERRPGRGARRCVQRVRGTLAGGDQAVHRHGILGHRLDHLRVLGRRCAGARLSRGGLSRSSDVIDFGTAADPIGYEDAIAAAVRGRQGGDAMSPWSHAYDIAGHQTDWTVIRKSTRR